MVLLIAPPAGGATHRGVGLLIAPPAGGPPAALGTHDELESKALRPAVSLLHSANNARSLKHMPVCSKSTVPVCSKSIFPPRILVDLTPRNDNTVLLSGVYVAVV